MDTTLIQIERKPAWTDLLRSYQIVLDGERVGTIRQGMGHAFEVSAGHHEIILTIDWCSSQRLSLYLEPGEKVKLVCQGRNPFLAFYYTTIGARNYIRLFREPFDGSKLF